MTSTRQTKKDLWNDLKSVKFSSLKELNSWFDESPALADKLRIPREAMPTSTSSSRAKDARAANSEMKLLVCHDFMGGYNSNEDDSPAGYFPHPSGEHYFLQFPSLIDTFIYFSHHRITVPPAGWVNMLHRQGIHCLGTIILEGTDNRDLDKIVTKDDDGEFVYVKKLVKLAQHYGFDGWLINVETTFTRASSALDILLFTESLRSEMHKAIEHSQVIWYDAFIAKKNRVFYQNGVNELNYDHFDSSDSFFTNYWWDENTLKKNILNVGLQGTKKKLFVGIDVWGRGAKVGKGGFDIGLAINFLRVYSANVALFAPAWTYENFEIQEFIDRDRKFWIGDMSDSYPGGSVGSYIGPYSTPMHTRTGEGSVVFYTNFSQGQGNGFKVLGKTVFNNHWVNISLQMPTPVKLDGDILSITKEDAFNGGSALRVRHRGGVNPRLVSESAHGIELFKFQTDVESTDLKVSLSFKQLSESIPDHFFQLEVEYYIERRFRSITRVKDGKFKIPLQTSSAHGWKQLETKFDIPPLQAREHFVLDGVSVKWTSGTSDSAMKDMEQSWIMIQSGLDPNMVPELLIGDLSIEGGEMKRSFHGVKRMVKKTTIDSNTITYDSDNGRVLVEWEDQEEVLMWLIYENAKFQRPLMTPCYMAHRMDKIRVDCVMRSGKLVTGMDIFV